MILFHDYVSWLVSWCLSVVLFYSILVFLMKLHYSINPWYFFGCHIWDATLSRYIVTYVVYQRARVWTSRPAKKGGRSVKRKKNSDADVMYTYVSMCCCVVYLYIIEKPPR
jgi:hypothetical protein